MTQPAAKPAKELKEPEKSLRFMQDPYQWPMMWLPLKRAHADGSFPDLAIMLGDGPVVYHVNPYHMSKISSEERKKALDEHKEVFLDYEGIVDAGWRVD